MAARKDPAAVALGRKGGVARKQSLSDSELKAQARDAARARWETWRAENPEKAAASEERRRKRAAKKEVKSRKPRR